jgi:hypothetical protein
MANIMCSIAKKALSKRYGHKNVSVKNGTGTAWGWLHVNIKYPKASPCTCEHNQWGIIKYCDSCKNTMHAEKKLAHAIVREALASENKKLYTYTDDGGYGDHNEMLLDVTLT